MALLLVVLVLHAAGQQSCGPGTFDIAPVGLLMYYDAKLADSWADGGTTWADRSPFQRHARIEFQGQPDVNRSSADFNRTAGAIRLSGKATQRIKLPNLVTFPRAGSTLIFTHQPPPTQENYGLFAKCADCNGYDGGFASHIVMKGRKINAEVDQNENHFGMIIHQIVLMMGVQRSELCHAEENTVAADCVMFCA